MADIDSPTQDITIASPDGLREMEVNLDNEGLVHDQDAHDLLQVIATGTGVVSASVTTSWEFFAENNKAFIADFGGAFTGGTTEQPFILLRNPASSGYLLRIKRLTLAVTTNTTGIFKLYRQPTITAAGTPLSISNYADTAVSGVALAYSIPTYSATGNSFAQFDVNAGGVGSIVRDLELALIMPEGDDLLITLAQGSNNNAFSANISWAEEEIET
jgi:hypothetical protein